jgi:DNA-binding response OmpR family regulator
MLAHKKEKIAGSEWLMSKHIIVVDDDKQIREIVTFVLSRHDFEVVVASNGQQLQHLLARQIPDLIILDVMMPGEDGYQIFSSLQSDPKTRSIPVMIMTAHAEDIYERISVDLGAAEHMTKPFHPLELVERVKELLQTTTQN